MTLRDKIEQEIRERGPIPFSRYMQMCLYHPELGYYARNAEQFGKAGDFYTSSDIHAVFGRLLARQFDEMWRALGSPSSIEILELGPGRGLFAQDVLDWSEKKFPAFFQALHYSLAESSPSLRAKLHQTLQRHFEAGKASLTSFAAASGASGSDVNHGVSTELAAERRQNAANGARRGSAERHEQAPQGRKNDSDAAIGRPRETESAPEGRRDLSPALLALGTGDSVSKSRRDDQESLAHEPNGKGTTSVVPLTAQDDPALAAEVPRILFANEFFDALPVEILSDQGSLRVSIDDGHFTETWAPSSEQELAFLDRYSVRPEPGERIEAPLLAQQCMAQIAASIPHGFFIFIDYGYTRAEQSAGRHRGTLMTYRQHSISSNPYEAPGEQDITAHANFTALAAVAERIGMQVQPLLTQSQFLMGIGEANQFADAFEDTRVPQERAKVALQLKHLVTPAGMGETFHVLVGGKGVDPERLSTLAGLSFGKSLLT